MVGESCSENKSTNMNEVRNSLRTNEKYYYSLISRSKLLRHPIKKKGTYDHIGSLGCVADGRWRSLQGDGGSRGGGSWMVRISRVDSAAGHNQLDEPPGLLQNAYGLLVGDVAVQRLAVDRQDLVALLEAAISVLMPTISFKMNLNTTKKLTNNFAPNHIFLNTPFVICYKAVD